MIITSDMIIFLLINVFRNNCALINDTFLMKITNFCMKYFEIWIILVLSFRKI